MPRFSQLHALSLILGQPGSLYIKSSYENSLLSAEEISNEIFQKTNLTISPTIINKCLNKKIKSTFKHQQTQKGIDKSTVISIMLKRDFSEIIKEMYLAKEMSAEEISNDLEGKTGIKITNRHLQRLLRKLGIIRSFSDAFNLAIKKGRKSYAHLKKSIKSSELRKGINLKLRYEVMQRDHFRCILCGQNVADGSVLVIDHIIPVVKGGNNNPANLRTLCRACNHGKMLLEEKI